MRLCRTAAKLDPAPNEKEWHHVKYVSTLATRTWVETSRHLCLEYDVLYSTIWPRWQVSLQFLTSPPVVFLPESSLPDAILYYTILYYIILYYIIL